MCKGQKYSFMDGAVAKYFNEQRQKMDFSIKLTDFRVELWNFFSVNMPGKRIIY